jgi:hypothetical protein
MKPCKEKSTGLKFGSAAYYRITVQGRLSESWKGRLSEMKIMLQPSDIADCDRTVLQGRISDQAQLNGVLDSLYQLHLPILSVERM